VQITRSLTFILVASSLSACNLFDGGGDSSTVCVEGARAVQASDGRTLCLSLSTVAQAPFQAGFFTARVTHRLHLTDAEGRAVDVGQDPLIGTIDVRPLMVMNSGHEHGTPQAASFEDSSDPAQGRYDWVAYYIMPSGPMMGRWYVQVSLEDRGAADPLRLEFQPEVALVAAPDVFSARLNNAVDETANMAGGSLRRPYTVWLHEVVPVQGGGHRLTLFLSTQDAVTMEMGGMTMKHVVFPALIPGQTRLHDLQGSERTVGTVTLRVSLDEGATWIDLEHQGAGRYAAMLTGMAPGQRQVLALDLAVDGLAMTTSAGAAGQLSFLVP